MVYHLNGTPYPLAPENAPSNSQGALCVYATDIHRLQRVEQVIQEVKERTPEKKPEQAPPDETVGHFLSEAATYAFQKPEVSSDEVEEIFKSTGMGYSGEPLTDEQRRKLQRVEQVVASVREEVEKTIDESEQQ